MLPFRWGLSRQIEQPQVFIQFSLPLPPHWQWKTAQNLWMCEWESFRSISKCHVAPTQKSGGDRVGERKFAFIIWFFRSVKWINIEEKASRDGVQGATWKQRRCERRKEEEITRRLTRVDIFIFTPKHHHCRHCLDCNNITVKWFTGNRIDIIMSFNVGELKTNTQCLQRIFFSYKSTYNSDFRKRTVRNFSSLLILLRSLKSI